MVRKGGRVKIQWIVDNKKRKATMRKRLPVLLKKADELAVLCDVPVCVVVNCPGEAQPVVYPSTEAASDVLRKYKDLPDVKSSKNTQDSTELLNRMKAKVGVKLSNVQRESRDEEINHVLVDSLAGRRKSFDDLPIDIFTSVGSRVENKIQAVKARLQELRLAAAPALLPPPPPSPVNVPMVLDGSTLPTTEEMHALLVQAGIFSPPLPNPSSL